MRALYLLCALVVGYAHADCQLSAAQIGQTNRIFAFRAESQFYPLRLDVVGTRQTLHLICNARDVLQTICQHSGSFAPALPSDNCEKPLKASVEPVADASCPFTMYRVGYKLSNDSNDFMELYRSCYDASTATAHFAIHLAYPKKLTVNRPAQAFTTDGVISGAMSASFEAKRIYARFKELLGSQQQYVTSARELVFDRGHLAPSADYVFESNMRQTFKYINVLAQFRTINRSNWKALENWVRKQLKDGRHEALRICSGGLDVLQLPDSGNRLKSIYLGAGRANPVPKWLFKIVSDGGTTRHAFLTYNNIHELQAPSPRCVQVPCPVSLQLQNTAEAGFTYCCNPNDFINKNVPNLAEVC